MMESFPIEPKSSFSEGAPIEGRANLALGNRPNQERFVAHR